MCQRGHQVIADVNAQMQAKAKACDGPFDRDGFPVVFSPEVQRLKGAIANARQGNSFVSGNAEVQSAIATLRGQMPFAGQWEQRQALLEQMRATSDLEERARLREQLQNNISQLSSDRCYQGFMRALATQLRPQAMP
jgi:ribosomal protein S13